MVRNSLIDDMELYAKYKYLERQNICALLMNIMGIVFNKIMMVAIASVVLMLLGYWLSHAAVLVIVMGMALFLAAISAIHFLIGNNELWRISYLVHQFSTNEYSGAARKLEEEYPELRSYDFSKWYIPTSWVGTEKSDLRFSIPFVEPIRIQHLAKFVEMCERQKRIVPYDEVMAQLKKE